MLSIATLPALRFRIRPDHSVDEFGAHVWIKSKSYSVVTWSEANSMGIRHDRPWRQLTVVEEQMFQRAPTCRSCQTALSACTFADAGADAVKYHEIHLPTQDFFQLNFRPSKHQKRVSKPRRKPET